MIARVWRAQAATAADADAYVRHFEESVRPTLSAIEGHRGALVLRREVDAEPWYEIVVVTFWASHEAIVAFAGPEPHRAVVEPAAQAVLSDFGVFVEHYDVVLDTRNANP